MIRLGIIGAMTVEVEALKENLRDMIITEKAGMQFCQGTLEGLDVVVVQCGVGKVNAALCMQILCDCFGVTHVANTGVAGSLDPKLDIGDLVISRDAMYHDVDCGALGYAFGQVPGMAVRGYPADEKLMREKEVIGFYVSGHPMAGYEALAQSLGCAKIFDFACN